MTDSLSKPSACLKSTLEAWSQGFMIGALVIMIGITLANMRRGVLLHKLILIELFLAVPNGFFIFFNGPVAGWYLSGTVVPLIASWTLHNIIAWVKNKPFLERRGTYIYIGSILLIQPYWIVEIYANFAYFNGLNHHFFVVTRPYEAVFRDPWWIFTIVNLFWNIKFRYELGFVEIVKTSPRFAVLLACMCFSVVFIIVDILSVTPKFAFVFKCFTDSIILDDFKTALDKLSKHRMSQILPFNIASDVYWTEKSSPNRWTGKKIERLSVHQPQVMEVENVSSDSITELSDVSGLCTPHAALHWTYFVNRELNFVEPWSM
ncbi:hypothetical protein F5Y08DRAFT_325462 [Xylaria arbuscula]|nr:hypothetical protein F5Y08DRAFT_325462 [Xylaria arbuscula]